MGQRIILSENEKQNIQKMYGLINEQSSNCSNSCKTDEEKENCLRDAMERAKRDGYTEVKNFTIYREKLPSFIKDSDNARKSPRVYCYWHNSGNIVVYYNNDYKDVVGIVSVNGKPGKTCEIGQAIFNNGLIDPYMSKELGIDPDKAKYYVRKK